MMQDTHELPVRLKYQPAQTCRHACAEKSRDRSRTAHTHHIIGHPDVQAALEQSSDRDGCVGTYVVSGFPSIVHKFNGTRRRKCYSARLRAHFGTMLLGDRSFIGIQGHLRFETHFVPRVLPTNHVCENRCLIVAWLRAIVASGMWVLAWSRPLFRSPCNVARHSMQLETRPDNQWCHAFTKKAAAGKHLLSRASAGYHANERSIRPITLEQLPALSLSPVGTTCTSTSNPIKQSHEIEPFKRYLSRWDRSEIIPCFKKSLLGLSHFFKLVQGVTDRNQC